MRTFFKWFAIGAAVAFLAIQVRRPERTNPPVNAANVLRAPANVQAILDRSCNDCHSNDTRWPWYSNIAPISWDVAHDVEHGREELNFSQWNAYTPKRKARKLEEICEEVEEGKMPLPKYLYTHREARLSEADKNVLCEWTRSLTGRRAVTPAKRAS